MGGKTGLVSPGLIGDSLFQCTPLGPFRGVIIPQRGSSDGVLCDEKKLQVSPYDMKSEVEKKIRKAGLGHYVTESRIPNLYL